MRGLTPPMLLRSVKFKKQTTSCAMYSATALLDPSAMGLCGEALKSAVTVPLIFWTLDTMDWSVRSKELVAHHIIENVRTGDIVLFARSV